MRELTVAHSPDSDDAFMFHGLVAGEVDTRGLAFKSVIADIETLNRAAQTQTYDVSAMSLHGWCYVRDKYLVMHPGASVGDGYGPMLVAPKPLSPRELSGRRIAIPGERTTAALLLKLYAPESVVIARDFDRIIDSVRAGDADVGLVIHEGQVTYAQHGLHKVIDLGEWWKNETGLPVVLGIVGIRRELPREVRAKASEAIRDSIVFGLEHRRAALESAKQFGRGMDTTVMSTFVSMYVNDFTVDLGESGERSAALLLQLAEERGLIPQGTRLEFE